MCLHVYTHFTCGCVGMTTVTCFKSQNELHVLFCDDYNCYREVRDGFCHYLHFPQYVPRPLAPATPMPDTHQTTEAELSRRHSPLDPLRYERLQRHSRVEAFRDGMAMAAIEEELRDIDRWELHNKTQAAERKHAVLENLEQVGALVEGEQMFGRRGQMGQTGQQNANTHEVGPSYPGRSPMAMQQQSGQVVGGALHGPQLGYQPPVPVMAQVPQMCGHASGGHPQREIRESQQGGHPGYNVSAESGRNIATEGKRLEENGYEQEKELGMET
ncbi:hypothetical protein L228DRAFT_277866 [Xylona heveae TC161]|uniref:Uncharacterized protein n=1 Tax=Xylona heveae (strain CBS 132557 / TC161) TaxID=1328760 RepID=A0A165G069_XYLHT|nr:hypothetical protein L228DRAFT_277866 [Xylona heveae TC161]KZF21587.1 hypothetical protein L228DRAFT_277866 [Xylona heveae TC161]